jgi:DnaJ-class molecular chaperone
MTIAQARAILGVSLNATQEDIEQAYRKMAAVFEVHRDEALGEMDVSVANSSFRKIQQAYHLLRPKT